MKQILFCLLLVSSVMVISCQKEVTAVNEPISSKSPAKLSAALKIWHGKRMTGTAPATNAATPSVTGPATVHSLAGGFAVIKPESTTGSIKGYYASVAGAGEYLNIDFTKPRIVPRPFQGRRHFLQRPLSGEDSSIVVQLPADLVVPDTFCITYAPYDSVGNIGQPFTTCIIVNQLGGDASSSWVSGSWRLYGIQDSATAVLNPYVYNVWTADQDGSTYYCDGGAVTSYCASGNCQSLNLQDSVYRYAGDFLLGADGAMSYLDSANFKKLNYQLSTCSSVNIAESSTNYRTLGGWSLTGNRMTLVFWVDEFGEAYYSAVEFEVEHPDPNILVLVSLPSSGEYQRVTFKRI